MANKKPKKPVQVPPQRDTDPASRAFDRLGEIKAEQYELRAWLRGAMAPILDEARLRHGSGAQISDIAGRFVREVTGKWQHEMNVEMLSDVKTKAVDMV